MQNIPELFHLSSFYLSNVLFIIQLLLNKELFHHPASTWQNSTSSIQLSGVNLV